MRRLFLFLSIGALALAACGGSDSTADAADTNADDGGSGDEATSIADRVAGPDDFVLVSNVTRGEVVIFADEAQDGLERIEDYLRERDPDVSGAVQCWLMQREDGTIHQAVRCGPTIQPDGEESWATLPFSSGDEAEADGRLVLRFEARLIGEVEPSMMSVDLVRPDGLEAPDEAESDVVEGTGATRPEEPSECTATGSVTDAARGEFDLADADHLEVTASVEDNADGSSYRHLHTLRSWDDDAGRGVAVSIRLAGIPGEEEVESVTVDLDVTNRSIMEGGGSGNPDTVMQGDLPPDLQSTYDPLTGGPIAVDLEIEGRYSYEEPNPVTTDITITCTP